MESTLLVLTECSTSGAGPRKEQIIARGLKWCFSFSAVDEGDVQGDMRLVGGREYFTEIQAFLVFSCLLKIIRRGKKKEKRSACAGRLVLLLGVCGLARALRLLGCNYPYCTSKL